MGARVSIPCDGECSASTGRKLTDGRQPDANLEPFNYAGSLSAPWAQLTSFLILPPSDYFHQNLPTDPDIRLLWSVDLHFAPRSERRLVASFAAHFPRPGMNPAPVNQHLSGGCISLWRADSRAKIACSVLPRLQSMSYPCQIAVHPARQTVCFAGEQGLAQVDLSAPAINGLQRVASAGKRNMGEVIKCVAISPSGARVLTLLRFAHSFHLRIVRLNSMSAVENEVRLSRLVPCLRLGRTYTECGHCTWSSDGRRVGFASSTGHYGVLLLLRKQRRQRRDSLSSSVDFGSSGDRLTLEWCHRPAVGEGSGSAATSLSAPRAFAFWPADPEDADDADDDDEEQDFCSDADIRCRCLLALGDAGGFLDIVGGFTDTGAAGCDSNGDEEEETEHDASQEEKNKLAKYRRLLRVPLCHFGEGEGEGEGEGDPPEVLQFSGSGRLLAVGCQSGGVRVYRFVCRQRLRRGRGRERQGESDSESGREGEDYAARAGICVSLQLLQLLEPTSATAAASVAPVVSLAFADTEEILASASAAGLVRLWRLPSPRQVDCGDGGAVASLAELCGRAVASNCRIGCVGRLPLPPSQLPALCPNLRDRRHVCRLREDDDGYDSSVSRDGDGTRTFSIRFF